MPATIAGVSQRASIRTVLALAAALTVAAPATAAAPAPLLPADAVVGGRSYSQWERTWVKWRLGLPIHATASQHGCITRGQSHTAVWFLDGNGNQPKRLTRHCDIPAGRHVLLGPWLICTNLTRDPTYGARTGPGLVRCARRLFRAGFHGFTLTLDGAKLRPPAHRTPTGAFRFRMPGHGNMLGLPGHTHGRAAVFADAALLAPLEAGRHTLKLTERYVGLTRRVTWKLTAG